ncbi:PepSY-associated TM helix domain-containing protein [Jiella mangrovi]|uniref:PepSY domain-containing protein n=1 Tax=Jiella mangrovi TaxID=2821407 RepID=A0ABS4BI84_9HYPH|nr:PepSY domain-containing protein [Jiella mangrovi]MBP0616472.1 PepSY domain-containing protein [Jiella mangrovi]
MCETTFGRTNDGVAARPAFDLYRAVWRWHFYAGLLVLPFMISLAITGGLYLFKDTLDPLLQPDLKQVEVVAGAKPVPVSQMITAALEAVPGTTVKVTDPETPDASAEITVATADRGKRAVYVDPYSGKVLGDLPDRGTIMWTIRTLHSLKYFGPYARALIEIAGGWSILLVGTGIYLWWPRGRTRGQAGGVVTLRGTPKSRMFWRDLHAVTGLFVGGFIVFLAMTGMPWSGVWGGKVNEWANGTNFGYPSGVRVDVPMSDARLAETGPTTWSLEQAELPLSRAPDGGERKPIGVDRAIAIVEGLGLHRGYALALPTTPTGVYSASVYPDDLSEQRVVHLDQYSGKPLVDMSYGDYGPAGKALEWGINTHMGQEYGLANKLILAAACLAIVVLAVSAAVMWWKRRPKGSLGVPPLPEDRRVFRGLIAILAIGGIVFPLVGLSLIIMLALDFAGTRLTRKMRAA